MVAVIYQDTISANELITGLAEKLEDFSFMLFIRWGGSGVAIQFCEKVINEKVGR